jgi:hypothetical protein
MRPAAKVSGNVDHAIWITGANGYMLLGRRLALEGHHVGRLSELQRVAEHGRAAGAFEEWRLMQRAVRARHDDGATLLGTANWAGSWEIFQAVAHTVYLYSAGAHWGMGRVHSVYTSAPQPPRRAANECNATRLSA